MDPGWNATTRAADEATFMRIGDANPTRSGMRAPTVLAVRPGSGAVYLKKVTSHRGAPYIRDHEHG
jgi:hypothetical protein